MASAVPWYQVSPARAHLRRHRNHELRLEQAAELPALAEVLQQRLAAELRQHIDRVDARVDEITQDEIDDAILAAKRNGRFGPLLGQRIEPGSLAAGQHDAQHPYAHRFRPSTYCSRHYPGIGKSKLRLLNRCR